MCTPKDVLDPSVDGQISYLCGRHDCSLLHFGDPVIGTVYDDRILVSSGQWWPLPRAGAPQSQGLAHTPRHGPGRTVITISQPDLTPLSGALLVAKQGHFTGHFALVAPHAERRQGATDQGKDRDKARQRATSTGRLAPWLGLGCLLGLGIGPRDGGAIDHVAATPGPEPGLGRWLTQALPTVAGQGRPQACREAFAGLTVTAGMGRAQRLALGDHPRAQATERLAARAIGRKDWQEKRPQGERRGKEPVAACNPFLGQDGRAVRRCQGALSAPGRRRHSVMAGGLKLTGQRRCDTLHHKRPPGGMGPGRWQRSRSSQRGVGLSHYKFYKFFCLKEAPFVPEPG